MTTYVLPTGGRDDFLLLGGGNKDHVTELNGGGGGGGPRISELEGKGALITSAGRAVFPPLFFSSRNKTCLKRLQKQKHKKLHPPTYLISSQQQSSSMPVVSHSDSIVSLSILRETRRRAL